MLKVSQELQQPCQAPQCAGVSSTGHWPVLSSPWGSDSTALARITFFSLLWCCYSSCFQLQSEENNFSGIHQPIVQINVCTAFGCHSNKLHSNPARK